ncbi:MAG: hypothetical protein HDKAJFGB_01819 [Anaerolineae bacterium]|nr:hypothetical protein [Anaerolineae bacterium]RIK17614.1 MAG: hypothetical protein DCC52_16760 [Chloroflexota bacterium]
MNDSHTERTLGESVTAFLTVILVFAVAATIDAWVVGSIENAFSQNLFLRAVSTIGAFSSAVVLALLTWFKAFETPNDNQNKILLAAFALELVVLLLNAGLAVSSALGIHEQTYLPMLRLVLIAAGMVTGIGALVAYRMADDQSAIKRMQRQHAATLAQNEIAIAIKKQSIMHETQRAQLTKFQTMYDRVLNSDEIYTALQQGAIHQALEFGEQISGMRLRGHTAPGAQAARHYNADADAGADFLANAPNGMTLQSNGNGNGSKRK